MEIVKSGLYPREFQVEVVVGCRYISSEEKVAATHFLTWISMQGPAVVKSSLIKPHISI